jgi:hypothetical protein
MKKAWRCCANTWSSFLALRMPPKCDVSLTIRASAAANLRPAFLYWIARVILFRWRRYQGESCSSTSGPQGARLASLPCLTPESLHSSSPPISFWLIGINEDKDGEAWTRFLRKEDMPWPQIRQSVGPVSQLWIGPERKIVVPPYVILDRDGLVLFKARGLEDASSLAKEEGAVLKAAMSRGRCPYCRWPPLRL